MGAHGFATSWFPGLAAFSPVTGMHAVLGLYFGGHGGRRTPIVRSLGPMDFAHLIAGWFFLARGLVLMLVRNLKRDYGEIRPLSRWASGGMRGVF